VIASTVTSNTFRNYFVHFAKNSGLVKFLGAPFNQTLEKPWVWISQFSGKRSEKVPKTSLLRKVVVGLLG